MCCADSTCVADDYQQDWQCSQQTCLIRPDVIDHVNTGDTGLDKYSASISTSNKKTRFISILTCALKQLTVLLGGVVVGRCTCDQQVASSTPPGAALWVHPLANCSHTVTSVTKHKQYNLAPVQAGR